jgi:hypothetical protein
LIWQARQAVLDEEQGSVCDETLPAHANRHIRDRAISAAAMPVRPPDAQLTVAQLGGMKADDVKRLKG